MFSFRKNKKFVMPSLLLLILVIATVLFAKQNNDFEALAAGDYPVYDFQDWVYYDPVTGDKNCGVNNYWTPYNTDTTCYRFFIAERNDNSSNDSVNLILDHNIGYGPLSSATTILADAENTWVDYDGELSLISENDLATLLTIQELPSIYKESDGSIHTIDKDGKYYRYASNTETFINGVLQNSYGWWTGTTLDFEGSTYAYTITEAGWNRLVDVTENRGIRPTIILDKTKISSSSHDVVDITNLVMGSQKYQYQKYVWSGTTFAQLQGFTVANQDFNGSSDDNLIFYSINSGNKNDGLISGYTGSNFSTNLNGPCGGNPCYSQGTGHGNDMTYNTNNHQVYILGSNYIWQYDGVSQPTRYVQDSTSSIGYDNFHNMYLVNSGFRVYVTDDNFAKKFMFDATTDEIGQGFEYHNGYLYYATSTTNVPCQESYHHCGSFNSMSSVIDVYNVKLDSDGTPGKNFGKREKRFYVDGDTMPMEIESISFRDNQAYLGYSNNSYPQTASDPPFVFYRFADSNIAVGLHIDTSYQDATNSTTVTISSGDQLQPVSGYTISADGYSMSKTVNAAAISDTVNVCDYYGNCTVVNILHTNPSYDPIKPVQIVTFATESVNKVYGDSNFVNSATTNGDGVITYASDNTSVAEVNSITGAVVIKSAGFATITATASATSAYGEGSASYTVTVSKATSSSPRELDNILNGVAGESLSTISFTTPGLVWSNSDTTIMPGKNRYSVYYTKNNDTKNYTTEEYTAIVDGATRTYEVIYGNGQIYTIGKSEAASFTVGVDFNLFKELAMIYIDGDIIDVSKYSARSDNVTGTVIDIQKDYLDTLPAGEHNLLVTFGESGVATAKFTILNPNQGDDPSGSDGDITDNDIPVPDTSTKSPDTGKNTKTDGISVTFIALFPVCFATSVYMLRRRKNVRHRKFDNF